MLPTIKITKVERLPDEEDEEPGMPTYKVTGSSTPAGGTKKYPFTIHSSCEIDGRDFECEMVRGQQSLMQDVDFMEAYQDALCKNEVFTNLHNKAAEEYYESYQP